MLSLFAFNWLFLFSVGQCTCGGGSWSRWDDAGHWNCHEGVTFQLLTYAETLFDKQKAATLESFFIIVSIVFPKHVPPMNHISTIINHRLTIDMVIMGCRQKSPRWKHRQLRKQRVVFAAGRCQEGGFRCHRALIAGTNQLLPFWVLGLEECRVA